VDTLFCIRDHSSKNRLELYGSRGSILAEDTIGQGDGGKMVAFLAPPRGYDARQARSTGRSIVIAPKPVNTYRTEIEDFSQALLDGRDTNESALRGLRSQIILEACYRSARLGKSVAIPPV
jgi:predicted dehydrogenase